MFNLDSKPTGTFKPSYTPTEAGIKDNNKEMAIKDTVGIAVSCVVALMLFIFTILYFRWRSNRLQQVVKDEDIPLT